MTQTMLMVENAAPQVARNGKAYFSFWVKIVINEMCISTAGWKYYPDTKTISSPSQAKGEGKFVKTTKLNPQMYNRITDVAVQFFQLSADATVTE